MPYPAVEIVEEVPQCGLNATLTTTGPTTYRLSRDCYVLGIVARVTTSIVGPNSLPIVDVAVADHGGGNLTSVASISFGTETAGARRVAMATAPVFVKASAGRIVQLRVTQAATGSGAAGAAQLYALVRYANEANFAPGYTE
jgi:hypothetical protein